MLNFKSLFAVFVGLVAYAAYAFYQLPVPEDFEEPNLFRLMTVFISVSHYALRTLDNLGVGTEHENLRALDSYFRTRAQIENVQMIDRVVDGRTLRLYRLPKLVNSAEKVPGMIFYHGGGFSLGDLDGYDTFVSNLVENTGINVVSVDYRLAPQHPFPTPTEDSYSATNYIFSHADEFQIDLDRLVLAGDSAGGTIVASVTQRLLKEGKKQPKLQVLIYPWLQMFNIQLPSSQVYGDKDLSFGKMIKWYLGILDEGIEHIIDHNQLYSLIPPERVKQVDDYLDPKLIAEKYIAKHEKEYYENYTNDHPVSGDEQIKAVLDRVAKDEKLRAQLLRVFTPEVSPAIAEPEDLKGLPKAYLAISQWDTLKDDGLIYAERLARAGVDVTIKYYPGAFHGLIVFHELTKTKMISSDLIAFIKENL